MENKIDKNLTHPKERKYFSELLNGHDFFDRLLFSKIGFDVIIPVLNTDIFFHRNLLSIYRQIPVQRLIIGDGGCTDDTILIAKKFPRVLVLDHKNLKSQGASIKALIDEIQTAYFLYCHADVYLPMGFYENVISLDLQNKWVESSRNNLVLREEFSENYYADRRSYSGVQVGDSALLKESVKGLNDDFIQRNEDIIIRELVESLGGIYRKELSLVHLHQSPVERGFGKPAYENREWAVRIWNMQLRGLVKYLPAPLSEEKKYLLYEAQESIFQLMKMNSFDQKEFLSWVGDTNPLWLPFFTKNKIRLWVFRKIIYEVIRRVKYSVRILLKGF